MKTKFKSDNHIIGKVYDLTQENMQAMLNHIDKLEEELDAALMVVHMLEKEKTQLRAALQQIADKGPASPGDKKHEIAKAAL